VEHSHNGALCHHKKGIKQSSIYYYGMISRMYSFVKGRDEEEDSLETGL
jgi:hypothetical protein